MRPTQPLIRHLRNIAVILFSLASSLTEAQAQLPGVSGDFCPPPAQFVPGGGGLMCVCPDGTPYNLGRSCGTQTEQGGQAEQIGDRCNGGGTCPSGSRCSWMPGRCVPDGKVDCGAYTCDPGFACASDQRYRACFAYGDLDCGSYSCKAGNKCASGGCIAQDATDCGNGISCGSGLKCSRNRKMCLQQDAVDCGNFNCQAGMKCASGNQCIAKDAIDCGKGKSCPSGTLCVGAQAECLTRQQIADRAAAEKRKKEEEAAAKKREAEERKAAELRRIEEQREASRRKEQEQLAAITKQKEEEQRRLAEKQKQEAEAKLAAKAKNSPSSSQTPSTTTNAPLATANADVQRLLSDPTIATSGNYARTINGSIIDSRTGTVVATGGVTIASAPQNVSPGVAPTSPPLQSPVPQAGAQTSMTSPRPPAAPAAPPPSSSSSSPKYTFAQTPHGTVEVLQDGKRIGTGTAEYAAQYGYKPPGASGSQPGTAVAPPASTIAGVAPGSPPPAQPSTSQASSTAAAPYQGQNVPQAPTNTDVRRLLSDPTIAVSGNYGRTINGSVIDLRTGAVVATGGITTVSMSAASGAIRAPPAVAAVPSSGSTKSVSSNPTERSAPFSTRNSAPPASQAAPPTHFHAQPTVAASTPMAILTQPQQTSGLWKSLETVAKRNQALLDSRPGQIVTETLAAAGDPFAKQLNPAMKHSVEYAKDVSVAAEHIRRKEYLELAEQAADKITVETAGALGVAGAVVIRQNPVLGQSMGKGAAQFAITTWKVYGAPAAGEWLVQQFPEVFIPPATAQ